MTGLPPWVSAAGIPVLHLLHDEGLLWAPGHQLQEAGHPVPWQVKAEHATVEESQGGVWNCPLNDARVLRKWFTKDNPCGSWPYCSCQSTIAHNHGNHHKLANNSQYCYYMSPVWMLYETTSVRFYKLLAVQEYNYLDSWLPRARDRAGKGCRRQSWV